MPTPPLPDVPCLRVRLVYSGGGTLEQGNRFYLSYAGSAPTGANCVSIATDIAAAWASDIAPLVSNDTHLIEVDVLDIATDSGASGQWTGNNDGSRGSDVLPLQCATNVEFDIARRYRGGKPRLYLPPPLTDDLQTQATWTAAFVTAANSGVAAFFAAVEAISVGAVGALAHVNLSFYKGYTNVTLPSGRVRAVPKYRATATHDLIEGYSTKVEIGSQRRRRTSTTP